MKEVTTENVKLKPCPFCGGQVAYSRYSISGEGRIKCPICQSVLLFLDMDKSEEEIARCWNRRKSEDELDAVRGAIKNCGMTDIDAQFTNSANAIEQMSHHILRLNVRLAAMERRVVDQQAEILHLNLIRSNLYSALSTYMDEDDMDKPAMPAIELANALQELLWWVTILSDHISRHDHMILTQLYDLEGPEINEAPACQRAQELLRRLGITWPSKGE